MCYRFRLPRRDLPGRPDIVLPRHHKVILVHGCFWHMHDCQYGRVVQFTVVMPQSVISSYENIPTNLIFLRAFLEEVRLLQ